MQRRACLSIYSFPSSSTAHFPQSAEVVLFSPTLRPVFAEPWVPHLRFADLALTLLLEYTSLCSGSTLGSVGSAFHSVHSFFRQIARLPACSGPCLSSTLLLGSASPDLGNSRVLMGPLKIPAASLHHSLRYKNWVSRSRLLLDWVVRICSQTNLLLAHVLVRYPWISSLFLIRLIGASSSILPPSLSALHRMASAPIPALGVTQSLSFFGWNKQSARGAFPLTTKA